MSARKFCSPFLDFASAKEEQANLLLACQAIVIWAGEQTEPGEWVGGKGEQNLRAARNLRLHLGVVERARACRSGPEIAPAIFEARDAFIANLKEKEARRWRSPWSHLLHPMPSARDNWPDQDRMDGQSETPNRQSSNKLSIPTHRSSYGWRFKVGGKTAP